MRIFPDYLHNFSPVLRQFLEEMKSMGIRRHIPNISWNTGNFLIETLRERPRAHILEIGPANGFSTMVLALACPEAHITSIECSRHAFEELRVNLTHFRHIRSDNGEGDIPTPADLSPKITSDIYQEQLGQFFLFYGNACEILPHFINGRAKLETYTPMSHLQNIPEQRFDVIFIDGAFRMTRTFFDLSRPLLHKNGLIILDDAIKYRWKMEGFHEYLEQGGIPYELIQTDEDDGVMVIREE